ncbi:AAA family ATPase [Phytoactinopolyspora alkaliphila]|uniref:AAA family ATPase n=1 Tax=Phytoactinopolyspora alkaliphila TaxID=1783498 RepID=A0A6N9YIZ2_9ACTN|nr:AAA family ATPase [Phytoactinopolyspora alkaliphila]NED94917.1 AAA family ATPase [Phytoactinopolyspora alkaliphila]
MTQLLERQKHLAELDAARRDASFGHGSFVLITGPAGVGKTALVREFVGGHVGQATVRWASCHDVLSPVPLGPFQEMFGELPIDARPPPLIMPAGRPAWLVEHYRRILGELIGSPQPRIMVVDDAQWADEATLEGMRFLAPRIRDLRVMIVMITAEAALRTSAPLRRTVELLQSANLRWLPVRSLSRAATARLAGRAGRSDVEALYRLTGGNPFFLHEALAGPPAAASPAGPELVLARVDRLDTAAKIGVQTASVVPGRAERWLLADCGVLESVDPAIEAGVLASDDEAVWFRHEIVRRAVEESLSVPFRRELNDRVLGSLAAHDEHAGRLLHHAHRADDGPAIAVYARQAARDAAALHCHELAAQNFERALVQSEHLSDAELADLLDAYGRECELTGVARWAYEALLQAVELRETIDDRPGLGCSLRRLSAIQRALGRGAEAMESARRAIDLLAEEPSEGLAAAYEQAAQLAAADHRIDDAIALGTRALETARELGEHEAAVNAAVTVGAARLRRDPTDVPALLDALMVARKHQDNDAIARTYVNLAGALLAHRCDDEAWRYLAEGLEHCEVTDLAMGRNQLLSIRAAWYFERGQWREAEDDVRRVLAATGECVATLRALRVLSLIETRRGEKTAASTVARAVQLADGAEEAETVVPIGLARAELAWFNGEPEQAVEALSPLVAIADEREHQWWAGESALWLDRAGALDRVPSKAAAPYRHLIEGRWKEAARYWRQHCRPYEHADALAAASDRAHLRKAWEILNRLGATRRAAQVAERLDRIEGESQAG